MIDRRHRTTLAELWAGSSRTDSPPNDVGGVSSTIDVGDVSTSAGQNASAAAAVVGAPAEHLAGKVDSNPQLVVLRGITGSGKSSLAKALQRTDPAIAWVDQHSLHRTLPQDNARRETADSVALVELTARFCLERGRTVVLEGTLRACDYGSMIKRVLADHPGRAYYLDVPVHVIGQRMDRPLPAQSPADRESEFSTSGDLLAIPEEVVIGKEPFQVTLARIRADLDITRTSQSRRG